MRRRRSVRRMTVLLAAAALAGGCNRQDAECLGRIGHLLRQRAEALKPSGVNGTLPLPASKAPDGGPDKDAGERPRESGA
jgi:hypothetical protein